MPRRAFFHETGNYIGGDSMTSKTQTETIHLLSPDEPISAFRRCLTQSRGTPQRNVASDSPTLFAGRHASDFTARPGRGRGRRAIGAQVPRANLIEELEA